MDWTLVKVTDVNRHFVPKDYQTQTLVYTIDKGVTTYSVQDGPSETCEARYTLVKQHPAEKCPGNCALHPLMCPLFRDMMRGDISWGTLCR